MMAKIVRGILVALAALSYGFLLLNSHCTATEVALLQYQSELDSLCQEARATKSSAKELRGMLERSGYVVTLHVGRFECSKLLHSGSYLANPFGIKLGAVVFESEDVVSDFYVYTTRRVF